MQIYKISIKHTKGKEVIRVFNNGPLYNNVNIYKGRDESRGIGDGKKKKGKNIFSE